MGRKVYSPILQTAKWGRSQKGKKKKLCEVDKGVFPSFFADRITCNLLCIPGSHWAPGKWHVHVGACFISVSHWALCRHTVTFTYSSWSLLSLHHYLSWQSHRSRMDTKTPDSAGLIWCGEDIDILQKRRGIQRWQMGPPWHTAPKAFLGKAGGNDHQWSVYTACLIPDCLTHWTEKSCKLQRTRRWGNQALPTYLSLDSDENLLVWWNPCGELGRGRGRQTWGVEPPRTPPRSGVFLLSEHGC